MPSPSDTAYLYNGHPHIVSVVAFSVYNMHYRATEGYLSIHHNKVRDLAAAMLKNVCRNVCIEPHLQPLSEEVMSHKSAITDIAACLDISARRFWGGWFEVIFLM